MKKILHLAICCFLLTGCAKLRHLDKLLVLNDMSKGKDRMEREIAQSREALKSLLVSVQEEKMNAYADKNAVLEAFGEPIFKRDRDVDGQTLEVWLYRDPIKYFNTDKVYLYFDEENQLSRWEYVPRQEEEDIESPIIQEESNGQIRQETAQ